MKRKKTIRLIRMKLQNGSSKIVFQSSSTICLSDLSFSYAQLTIYISQEQSIKPVVEVVSITVDRKLTNEDIEELKVITESAQVFPCNLLPKSFPPPDAAKIALKKERNRYPFYPTPTDPLVL